MPSSTFKKQHHSPSSSPIFNFITPLTSPSHPVSYYTPLSQNEHHSHPTYAHHHQTLVGSQTTLTPISYQHDFHRSSLREHDDQLYQDFSTHHRSDSRLRWLAGLAGAMILAMILCGNRIGNTQHVVLPLRSFKYHLTNITAYGLSKASSSDSAINRISTTDPATSKASIITSSASSEPDEVRYLFPLHIGEQETKASSHLLQIGLLARSLNRTLVLPHVGSGYISQCKKLPFETYYSVHAFERWGIRTISQIELEDRLRSPIKVQHLTFTRRSTTTAQIGLTRYENGLSTKDTAGERCISQGLADQFEMVKHRLEISGPAGWHRSSGARQAFRDATVEELMKDDQIGMMLVEWRMLYSLIETPVPEYVQLEYDVSLELLSERIVEILGGGSNILGIHWRQETVPVPIIERCAKVLDRRLRAGREEWIWIASDYPFESLLDGGGGDGEVEAHSGTFHTLTKAHHEAMRGLVSKLRTTASISHRHRLMTLSTFLTDYEGDSLIQRFRLGVQDRGRLGILEKLVLRRLDRVMVGSEKIGREVRCSKGSSYSRQIVKMHHEFGVRSGDQERIGRRREVEFWG